MSPKSILQAFAICSSFYGSRFQTPSDPQELKIMAGLWVEALADLPDEIGLAAFKQHGSQKRVPPTPADIRSLIAPPGLPAAGAAWSEVWESARTLGYCGGTVPQMSCPEIRVAAEAAGWSAICLAKNENELSFTRSQFFRIFDGLASRSRRQEERTQLEGRVPAELVAKIRGIKTVDGAIEPLQMETAREEAS